MPAEPSEAAAYDSYYASCIASRQSSADSHCYCNSKIAVTVLAAPGITYSGITAY